MARIYVGYKMTDTTNNVTRLGIVSYKTEGTIHPIEGTTFETQLLKTIGKKTPLKSHTVEWLCQNIEKNECKRFMEMKVNKSNGHLV